MRPFISSLASSASWRLILLSLVACGPTQNLGPAVTCTNVSVVNASGECDLVANEPCSDTSIYEIDCGDDSTCSCIENGVPGTSFLASNQTSGFCASFDATKLHDLATNCIAQDGTHWNINPPQ